MSVSNTGPPPRRSQPKLMSPVPPARSSSVCRGRGSRSLMKICFQTRWMPSDIRSFIRS